MSPPTIPSSLPISIGLDILHLPRLRNLLSRRSPAVFARRILSAREIPRLKQVGQGDKFENVVRFLGVRWAAKEACYKAFASEKLLWKEVSVEKEESGQPFLRIERDGKVRTASLSVSHDGEYIGAVVLGVSMFGEFRAKMDREGSTSSSTA